MDHLHAQYDQSSGTPDIRSHTISGRPSSAGCYTPWREATGLTCSPSQRDGADGLPKSTTSSVLCLRLSLPNYHADAAELDVPPQDYPDYAPLDELPESLEDRTFCADLTKRVGLETGDAVALILQGRVFTVTSAQLDVITPHTADAAAAANATAAPSEVSVTPPQLVLEPGVPANTVPWLQGPTNTATTGASTGPEAVGTAGVNSAGSSAGGNVVIDPCHCLEIVRQGANVGFRSAMAEWRYVQPRRRPPHQLVCFNTECGLWEQWEVIDEASLFSQPWSHISVSLRNRRLPHVTLSVDMVRVGRYWPRNRLPFLQTTSVSSHHGSPCNHHVAGLRGLLEEHTHVVASGRSPLGGSARALHAQQGPPGPQHAQHGGGSDGAASWQGDVRGVSHMFQWSEDPVRYLTDDERLQLPVSDHSHAHGGHTHESNVGVGSQGARSLGGSVDRGQGAGNIDLLPHVRIPQRRTAPVPGGGAGAGAFRSAPGTGRRPGSAAGAGSGGGARSVLDGLTGHHPHPQHNHHNSNSSQAGPLTGTDEESGVRRITELVVAECSRFMESERGARRAVEAQLASAREELFMVQQHISAQVSGLHTEMGVEVGRLVLSLQARDTQLRAAKAVRRRALTAAVTAMWRRRAGEVQAATFACWLDWSQRKAQLRRLQQRGQLATARRRLEACWQGWRDCTAQRRRLGALAVRGVLATGRRRVRTAWDAWQVYVTNRQQAKSLLSHIAHRWDTESLQRAFAAWQQLATETHTHTHVASQWRSTRLARSVLLGWQTATMEKQVKRRRLARAEAWHSAGALRGVFLGWREAAALRARDRRAATAIEARRAARVLSAAVSDWRAAAQHRARADRRVRTLTARRARRCLAAVLTAWHNEVAHGRRRRDAAAANVADARLRLLSRAWFGWWSRCERTTRAVLKLRAVATHNTATLARDVLRAWAGLAAHRYTQRSTAIWHLSRTTQATLALGFYTLLQQASPAHATSDNATQHSSARESSEDVLGVRLCLLNAAWQGWRQCVGATRTKVSTGAHYRRTCVLRATFAAWRVQTAAIRAAREDAVAFAAARESCVLSAAFVGWQAHTQHKRLTSRLVARHRQKHGVQLLRDCFYAWWCGGGAHRVSVAGSAGQAAGVAMGVGVVGSDHAVRLLQRATLHKVFQAWHAQAQVSAHQTHTANTQWCGTVLRAWHVATNARRTQRNLLLRTQLRKEQRLMCRVFTAWVDLVTQARVARAAADGLAGRRDRALLARAWQGLQAGVTVGYLTHNAAVRMAQRRTQTTLRAAWGAWCDLAAMRAVAHAKAEALSQRRCVAMVARVLRAWRAETADATSAMRAGELRHVRSLYTRVWRGWTGAVKQSRVLSVSVGRFTQRQRARQIHRLMQAWSAAARQSSARRARMQQYGLRWRAYSLRRVIKGWLEVVKESRRRTELLQACIKRKKIAFDQFKTWYWETLDGNVQATIAAMFDNHTADTHSPDPSPTQHTRHPYTHQHAHTHDAAGVTLRDWGNSHAHTTLHAAPAGGWDAAVAAAGGPVPDWSEAEPHIPHMHRVGGLGGLGGGGGGIRLGNGAMGNMTSQEWRITQQNTLFMHNSVDNSLFEDVTGTSGDAMGMGGEEEDSVASGLAPLWTARARASAASTAASGGATPRGAALPLSRLAPPPHQSSVALRYNNAITLYSDEEGDDSNSDTEHTLMRHIPHHARADRHSEPLYTTHAADGSRPYAPLSASYRGTGSSVGISVSGVNVRGGGGRGLDASVGGGGGGALAAEGSGASGIALRSSVQLKTLAAAAAELRMQGGSKAGSVKGAHTRRDTHESDVTHGSSFDE